MSIPKVIYQTYSTTEIPFYAKIQVRNFRRRNKNYRYEFYDDQQIEQFIKEHFNEKIYNMYQRIQIGAAKADFFRYAILYINGGIYLDLDSSITGNLDDQIDPNTNAIIAREKNNKHLYAQWALIYEKKHPILKRTLEIILNNINNNKHSHSVHQATGPTPYSIAVHEYIRNRQEDDNLIITRDNYKGIFRFKTILARVYELFNKEKHWRQIQVRKSVYTSK